MCLSFNGRLRPFCLLLILPLLFLYCDTQKFIDFDYDAQQLAKTVPVSGTITNIFTDEPVENAEVSFEGQPILTDVDGDYQGNYFLSVDDDANRPVPVTITADKYFSFDTSLVIFPVDNRLNASLIYAAPIVLSGSINQDGVVTAIIFDYQGAANIDSVFALGWYAPTTGSRINFYHEVQMMFVRQVDSNSAEYQVQLPEQIPAAVLLTSRIRFRLVDHDGFEEDTLIL